MSASANKTHIHMTNHCYRDSTRNSQVWPIIHSVPRTNFARFSGFSPETAPDDLHP